MYLLGIKMLLVCVWSWPGSLCYYGSDTLPGISLLTPQSPVRIKQNTNCTQNTGRCKQTDTALLWACDTWKISDHKSNFLSNRNSACDKDTFWQSLTLSPREFEYKNNELEKCIWPGRATTRIPTIATLLVNIYSTKITTTGYKLKSNKWGTPLFLLFKCSKIEKQSIFVHIWGNRNAHIYACIFQHLHN